MNLGEGSRFGRAVASMLALAAAWIAPGSWASPPTTIPIIQSSDAPQASPERLRLIGLTQQAEVATEVHERIRLFKEIIALANSIAPWPEALPRDTWLARIWHSLGMLHLERPDGDTVDKFENAIEAFEMAQRGFEPEAGSAVAENQMLLGQAYIHRRRGDTQENLEKAIRALEPLVSILDQQRGPHKWASLMRNLGFAYSQLRRGDIEENSQLAILYLEAVATPLQREADPLAWAANQTNLSNAYARRGSNRADNLQKAITATESALTVYARDEYPRLWALSQGNLGLSLLALAMIHRTASTHDPAAQDETRSAIEALEAALTITTHAQYPAEWESITLSLGAAYRLSATADRPDAVTRAIAAYEAFFSATTADADPLRWARAKQQLGLLYLQAPDRFGGDHKEQAIEALMAAEALFAQHNDQGGWAEVQGSLGFAYYDRGLGVRGENIETAIARFEAALKIFDQQNKDLDWSNVQHGLGAALLERTGPAPALNFERAIRAFEAALVFRRQDNKPLLWMETQARLCRAYYERLEGDPGANISLGISSCRSAQQVATKASRRDEWAALELRVATMLLEHPQERAENVERAISSLQEVATVYTRERNRAEWAHVQLSLGTAYRDRYSGSRVENLELSLTTLTGALSVLSPQTEAELWSDATNALGLTYYLRKRGSRLHNIEKALELYEEALTVLTAQRSPRRWASLQNNRGLALEERIAGDRAQSIEEAIASYRRAIEVYASLSLQRHWAETQGNLGNALKRRIFGSHSDNMEQATAAFESSLAVTTVEQFPDLWATLQSGLANARLERVRGSPANNIEDAIHGYKQALKIHTKDKYSEDWARLQTNLAGAYRQRLRGDALDNRERSIHAYEQALTVLPFDEDPDRWAFVSENLGHAYRDREQGAREDNVRKALGLYEEVSSFYLRTDDLDRWALVELNAARAERELPSSQQPSLDKISQRLTSALKHIRAETRPLEHLLAMHFLGNIMAALSEWKQALEYYEAAITDFRLLFGSGVDEANARYALENAGSLFADGAYAAAKLADAQHAIALLEDGKARLLRLSLRIDSMPLTAQQRTRRDELRARLRDAERSYRNVAGTARSESLVLQQTLRIQLAEVISSAISPPVTPSDALDAIAQSVADGRAVVAPLLTAEGGVILVAVSHNGSIRLSITEAPAMTRLRLGQFLVGERPNARLGGWFGAYMANYISRYDNRQQWKDWLSAVEGLGSGLWSLVGQSIADALLAAGIERGTELVIVPQGTLGILPIGLAQDPYTGRRLMDDYLVTYAPSLAALAVVHERLGRQKSTQAPTLAAIVDPNSDLRFSVVEGTLVSSYFANDAKVVLQGESAQLDAVLRSIKGRDYWHFATHGKFNWMDPRESGLILSEKQLLSVDALVNADSLGTPRLVVLSACETGLHDTFKTPEEFSGLPAAFLQIGASAVLSTLWPVDDLSTALLISKFYDLHRGQGLAPALALQQAQGWLKQASLEALRAYAKVAVQQGRITSNSAEPLVNLRAPSEGVASLEGVAAESRTAPFAQDPVRPPSGPLAHKPFEHPFFWGGFVLTGR